MLARKLVVGAELGEDSDHHAPDQVAALVVQLVRHALLQALEGGLEVGAVPGREGRGEPGGRRAVLGQAGARGEALGEEVSGVAVEQLERLGVVAAVEQDPRQRDRGAGVVGVQLQRLAQCRLVTGGRELIGARGDEGVEERLDLGRRDRARELGGDAPVPERLHRRDPLDPEARRERLVGVHVHLRQLDLARPLGDRGLERRGELAAGAAPGGPEVDDHRQLAGALDHPGDEVVLAYVVCHSAIEGSEGAESSAMDESLRGRLLVASPALLDPNFARTVVLVTEHGEEGAMGVVLNRPSETAVDEVAPELAGVAGTEPVFIGGPVQPQALVVLAEFADPDAAAWIVAADVGFVSAEADRDDLERAVRRGRVYAGYSGWGAGQLEGEVAEEAWIIEPPMPAELFPDDPASLWSGVLARKGGQFALIARMPEDPSLN